MSVFGDPRPNVGDHVVEGLQLSYSYILVSALSIYLWDFVFSFSFDWRFLSLKERLRWDMAVYFAGRYLALSALLGSFISLFTTANIDSTSQQLRYCLSTFVLFQLLGPWCIGLASMNLGIRVLSLWTQRGFFIRSLLVVMFVIWGLIISDLVVVVNEVYTTRPWYTDNCIGPSSAIHTRLSLAISVLAVLFDLSVLVALWIKLRALEERPGESPTSGVLLRDGRIYFLTSFLVNTASLVITALALASHEIHFSYGVVLSGTFSTIVASRAVRHLTKHKSRKAFAFLPGDKMSISFPTVADYGPAFAARGARQLGLTELPHSAVHGYELASFHGPPTAYPHCHQTAVVYKAAEERQVLLPA